MKAIIQGDIPNQIPMIEGDLNLEVFGGKYIPKPNIIAVEQKFNNASNKFNDTTFLISVGQLNSIYKVTKQLSGATLLQGRELRASTQSAGLV